MPRKENFLSCCFWFAQVSCFDKEIFANFVQFDFASPRGYLSLWRDVRQDRLEDESRRIQEPIRPPEGSHLFEESLLRLPARDARLRQSRSLLSKLTVLHGKQRRRRFYERVNLKVAREHRWFSDALWRDSVVQRRESQYLEGGIPLAVSQCDNHHWLRCLWKVPALGEIADTRTWHSVKGSSLTNLIKIELDSSDSFHPSGSNWL